jgi:hypothetical protein
MIVLRLDFLIVVDTMKKPLGLPLGHLICYSIVMIGKLDLQ